MTRARSLALAAPLAALALGLASCFRPVVPPAGAPAPPPADDLRAATVKAALAGVRAELARNGGTWDAWITALGPYRTNLQARMSKLQRTRPHHIPECGFVLPSLDGLPLFEIDPHWNLQYVNNTEQTERFRKSRFVVAADRWFKQRGVDLIFVPAPKMTEVYPDRFAAHCPPDRIVAPQIRRVIHDLLEADVEVADPLLALIAARAHETGPEYLYQPADTHWGPHGQAVAAKVVADRMQRYQFAMDARAAPPAFDVHEPPFLAFEHQPGLPGMPEDWVKIARTAHPRVRLELHPNKRTPDVNRSPVLLMGNSYGVGFHDHLCRELNLPVVYRCSGGQTLETFVEMLRDPELLRHVRVVVWVITNQAMWEFQQMPKPVLDALNEKG